MAFKFNFQLNFFLDDADFIGTYQVGFFDESVTYDTWKWERDTELNKTTFYVSVFPNCHPVEEIAYWWEGNCELLHLLSIVDNQKLKVRVYLYECVCLLAICFANTLCITSIV